MDEHASKLLNSGVDLSTADLIDQPWRNSSSAVTIAQKSVETGNQQIHVPYPNGIPTGKSTETHEAVENERNAQKSTDVIVKATPTWQGAPITIKLKIFGHLDAVERCIVSLVTPFDKMLLKNSGFIFTRIDIEFNANEFKVKILEGTGKLYELKKKDRLVQLMAILKNPETQIHTMSVYSEGILGYHFRQMLKAMNDFKIPKSSINIQNLKFEEKVNSFENCITTFLKYADPQKLQHLKVQVYMFDEQYLLMSRTPQWNSVDRLELHSVGILPYKPIFENWTGSCLAMTLRQSYFPPDFEELFDEFEKKQTGMKYHSYSDQKFIIGSGEKFDNLREQISRRHYGLATNRIRH